MTEAASIPCPNHQELTASVACERCGDFLCGECLVPNYQVCLQCLGDNDPAVFFCEPWTWAGRLKMTLVTAVLSIPLALMGMLMDGDPWPVGMPWPLLLLGNALTVFGPVLYATSVGSIINGRELYLPLHIFLALVTSAPAQIGLYFLYSRFNLMANEELMKTAFVFHLFSAVIALIGTFVMDLYERGKHTKILGEAVQ